MNSYSKNYSDHSNCAHGWAHQLTAHGYSSNFFFDGPTIYSYGRHFPVATLYSGFVFFTLDGYSKSTAKHKSRALSAASHLEIVYVKHMPVIMHDGTLSRSFADQNINAWIQQLKELSIQFRAQPRKKSLLGELGTVKRRIQKFVRMLNLNLPGELSAILQDPTFAAITAYTEREKLVKAELEKKRLMAELRRFKGQLKRWEGGQREYIYLSNPQDPNLAYLRLDEQHQIIETSKQIKVPLPVAKRFWQYVQDELRYPDVAPCEYEIMGFPVKEISKTFIIVGCHKIPMAQARKMAKRLGWI